MKMLMDLQGFPAPLHECHLLDCSTILEVGPHSLKSTNVATFSQLAVLPSGVLHENCITQCSIEHETYYTTCCT